MERYCPQYKAIYVGGLSAEQFAIKNDQFYRENRKLRIYQNAKFAKSTKKLVNFDCELLGSQTTHRNGFILLKSQGQGLSKKYRTISVGGLWAEQFARKK